MSAQCQPRGVEIVRRAAKAASVVVLAIGLAVLIGWFFDIPRLKTFVPAQVTMNPVTALSFVLLAAVLWLQGRVEGPNGRGTVVIVLLTSLAAIDVLLAILGGWDSLMDRILFGDALKGASPPHPMPPMTAIDLLLIGFSLLLIRSPTERGRRGAQVLALLSGLIALLPALGFFFQVTSPASIGAPRLPMSAPSALAFMLLAAGALASRPEQGLMALLCSERLGGRMLRRLLPALLVIPILLGWVRLWLEHTWSMHPVLGAGVAAAGMLVITTVMLVWNADLLDRIDAILSDREAKLNTLIESSPDLILIRDLEGRYVLANPSLGRVMGRAIPDVLGKRDEEIFEEATARRIMESDRRVIASRMPETYEIIVRDYKGEDRTFYSSKYPYLSPEGEVVGVIAISRDITERKQVEEALRLSQQRIRAVLENSPVFLFSVDMQGRVLLAKGKGLEALDLHPSEVAGQAITEAFQAFPAFETAYRRALSGESFRTALDAGESSFDVWFTPLRDESGAMIIGVIGVATDVTERKRLEAQLRAQYEKLKELDTLKSDFVNAVSHDLRTPLTSILGYAEFLEDEIAGTLTERQREFVAQISKSSMRLEGMVSDLLDFARLDAGTFRLHCEETDLAMRVRGIVDSLLPQAEEADLTLEADLPEGPVVRVLDPQRIERVLANLIGNALKFTPAGGRIEVRLTEEPDGILCEVTDTGIGIAAEDLPKLFQRFTQLASGGRMKSGSGLGLSISKAQVEAHGGTIGVRSALGQGSTFWFRLPRSVSPQCREEPPAEG